MGWVYGKIQLRNQIICSFPSFRQNKTGGLLYLKYDKCYKKEDDLMSALAQYLEVNREKAYSFATANTKYNKQGRPVISEEDEWVNESEWDDLFEVLKNQKHMEK